MKYCILMIEPRFTIPKTIILGTLYYFLNLSPDQGGSAAKGSGPATPPPNEGARRLLAAAAQGDRLDKRLDTAIAAATGAQGNSTALVGTSDQVAEALLDYYDLGVTTFLLRGFDPYEDAVQYGRELLPAFRNLLSDRARGHAVAAE